MLKTIDGISIFGEHDEGTLVQIKNVASDSNVVSAALCADGHKG